MLEIQEDALFIADSHYPHHGNDFLEILQKIEEGRVKIPQLFLMGDNFDLLFGYNSYIQHFSKDAILLLQRISKEIEVYYFEGNHDFCLADLFPEMTVYSRRAQPQYFMLGRESVGLSHGDKYAAGMGYHLYSTLLRHPFTLTLLRPFERWIIDHRMRQLSQKDICRHFEGFKKRVEEILHYYKEVDYVIEGHFHQSKIYGKYISLPSLACQKMVGRVKEGRVVFTTL